jgi:hypothetical protein
VDLLSKSNFRRTFVPQSTEAGKERQASPRALKEPLSVACLQPPQRSIKPTVAEQIAVRSALDDFSMMKDENQIRVRNRAQSVGYGDGGASRHQDTQSSLNLRFDLTIYRARCLVQQQQRRVSGNGARERKQLSFADAD